MPRRCALVNGLPESIWDRLEVGDCWEWTGALDRYGYGKSHGGWIVHRRVYEALAGPIPDGLQLDHLCRNRRCANPDHLEPVTPAENSRRGISNRGRPTTKCRNGHERTAENTRWSREGWQICVICQRQHCRTWYRRQRAA